MGWGAERVVARLPPSLPPVALSGPHVPDYGHTVPFEFQSKLSCAGQTGGMLVPGHPKVPSFW